MKIFSFGEVLWDDFAGDRKIGGAPLNLAAHICRVGLPAGIVSAVGADDLGKTTAEVIGSLGVSCELLGVNEYPTGLCRVSKNEQGFPVYDIVENSAYDNLILNDKDMKILNGADLFCFGTLSQRSAVTRNTLTVILEKCSFRHIFCDLNIRQNYYDEKSLMLCLDACDILKISREEVGVLFETKLLEGSRPDFFDNAALMKICSALAEKYGIRIVLLTLDKDGAMVYNSEAGECLLSRKPQSKMVSAVGAGDSFSACFLAHYLYGEDIGNCLDKAVSLSDYVVTQLGAVPEYTDGLKAEICLK